jgi:hypothetical protein
MKKRENGFVNIHKILQRTLREEANIIIKKALLNLLIYFIKKI